MPIVLNRRAVGALGVDLPFKAERDFESNVKFLGVVASLIAQAVRMQRLVEQDRRRLVAENTQLKQELRERYDFSAIIGTSGPVRQMYEQVAPLRPSASGRRISCCWSITSWRSSRVSIGGPSSALPRRPSTCS